MACYIPSRRVAFRRRHAAARWSIMAAGPRSRLHANASDRAMTSGWPANFRADSATDVRAVRGGHTLRKCCRSRFSRWPVEPRSAPQVSWTCWARLTAPGNSRRAPSGHRYSTSHWLGWTPSRCVATMASCSSPTGAPTISRRRIWSLCRHSTTRICWNRLATTGIGCRGLRHGTPRGSGCVVVRRRVPAR
jgi:hypothetical protein